MDTQIWLCFLITTSPGVLSYSETVILQDSCAFTVYELDTFKTIYVVWNGITLDRNECRLTFKPSSYTTKNLRACASADVFNIDSNDCDIDLRISGDPSSVQDYRCNQSFSRWCGNENKAIHMTLIGAKKANISNTTKFRLKIATVEVAASPNTETVIFVAFLGGFIVISTALCLIRHFSYKHCGGRQRRTRLNNNNTNTELPQDNSFLRGFALPPPSYSFVMTHPSDPSSTVNPDGQTNGQTGIPTTTATNVRFGLSPSSTTMASSSTGTLPPSYSSLQLSNIQIITPS